jgi:hypothetical protein
LPSNSRSTSGRESQRDNIFQNFDEFNGPCLKAEGFSVLRMAHARRRQTQVEGNTYQVATLVSALSALKTGTLSIGSMDVKFVLQLPLSPGRFGFMQYQNRQVALSADPESVTVLNLPGRTSRPTSMERWAVTP